MPPATPDDERHTAGGRLSRSRGICDDGDVGSSDETVTTVQPGSLLERVGQWIGRMPPLRIPSAVASVAAVATDRVWSLRLGRRVLEALEQPEPSPPAALATPWPVGFPTDVPLFRTRFERFDGSQSLPGQWRAIPGDERQLLELAGWAQRSRRTLRPLGSAHTWSPTMDQADIAVDMRRFRGIAIDAVAGRATFGAGLTLEDATRAMEPHGRMFADVPAVGEATVGGAAAMGTHGTGFTEPGGTLSAGIVELRAVVFDGGTPRVVTFAQGDPELAFAAMHLGSLLVTQVTFETIPARHFQLVASNARTMQYLAGRGAPSLPADLRAQRAVELMWFADQGRSVARQMLLHRAWDPIREHDFVRRRPYAELFVNFATRDTDHAVRDGLRHPDVRRGVGANLQRFFRIAAWRDRKLSAQAAQLYSSGFILRFRAAGWCLVCRRDGVPALIDAITQELHVAQRRWDHAWTGPAEVRMTCVDPAHGPLLSAARASDPGSVAVWLNLLADPDDANGRRMREVETFLLGLVPRLATSVRGEWSKAFAFDEQGRPWSDATTMARLVDRDAVAEAREIHDRLDPDAVFSSPLARMVL